MATKLRPNRVFFGTSCLVIIERDGINEAALANNTALFDVGLNVKTNFKIYPRLFKRE